MATETDTGRVTTLSHRVAIATKYLGPTNHRGSRIKATAGAGRKSLTIEWDYALGVAENHAEAIRQYVDLMGWGGQWIVGAIDGGSGYVGVWGGE